MTAIPVRYVHDPTADTPKMLVPFADQLNMVLGKLKKLSKEEQGRNYLQRHLAKLLEEIDQGLEIKSVYCGIPEIRKASTNIHDIFRLSAADEFFGTSLLADLPLDWSQGLDTYLTVHAKFPGMDILSGLIEFSVVDTPGINEAGVKKLRLHNTIRDTLQVCNYAVMVTTLTNARGKELDPIKKMFAHIKSTLKTPVMAFVTFSETLIEKSPSDPAVVDAKENVLGSLCSVNPKEPMFDDKSVFLVSATRKILGSQMLAFLNKHGRKPLITNDSPEAMSLANEWTASLPGFPTEEERLVFYEGLLLNKLRERCEKQVETSNMDEPLNKMAREALTNGIPTSVRHCLLTAIQRVDPLVKKLSCTASPESIKAALMRGSASLTKLVQLQAALREELKDQSDTVKAGIQNQREALSKELATWTTASPQGPLYTAFLRQLSTKADPKAVSLASGTEGVSFLTQTEALKTLATIEFTFKDAIEEILRNDNERVAEDLTMWGNNKKMEVRTAFTGIARTYNQCLDIHPKDQVFQSMKVSLNPKEQISPTFDSSLQLLIRKSAKKGPIFTLKRSLTLWSTHSCTVNPSALRSHLVSAAPTILDAVVRTIEVEVDSVVKTSLKPFVEDSIEELLRLQGIVKEKVIETEVHMVLQQDQPRRLAATKIADTISLGHRILIVT